MYAELSATVIKPDGTRIPYGVVCRKKVTRAFASKICQNLAGTATNIANYKYHDAGTGTNAEANTDTALQTVAGPTTRGTGTQAAGGSGDTYTYRSIGTTGPYSVLASLTEHVLADSASRATSEIMDRSVFSASAVVAQPGDSVEWDYTLSVNAEA